MARTLYVGPTSAGSADGSSWANRYGSNTNCEAKPVAAGDTVYVGPGTYRETLTCGVSGGNPYSTGTISVANGSATVTGSSTLFNTSSNVLANFIFWVLQLAHGTNGVATNATAGFTSAGGNFQAGHVGHTIRIGTIGSYIIASIVSATSITVRNADNTTPTFSGQTGLTYDVGPEQPYTIASITDNTHLTLAQPWSGPTLTGLAYITYNPISYIADVTGAFTDGVGGPVRITGSDNDQTNNRSYGISCAKNYRCFQGFTFDGNASFGIYFNAAQYTIVTDCDFKSSAADLYVTGAALGVFIF